MKATSAERFSWRNKRCAFIALVVGVVLAWAPRASFAEELSEDYIALHPDETIAKIVYTGNKKTRESAMSELAGLKEGERLGEIDVDALRQRLLKSSLFSEISLSCDLGVEGAVVTVRVTEKWTFIPLPYAAIGTDSWSAGGMVLDFNAFGLRKTLLVGGLFNGDLARET